MSQSHAQPRRGSSDFSIERILAKDHQQPASSTLPARAFDAVATSQLMSDASALRSLQRLAPIQPLPASTTNTNEPQESQKIVSSILIQSIDPLKQKDDSNLNNFASEELTWLRCTRYRPPKLPRKSRTNKILKRKPGSHPRIPFTTYQLETLENKYKTSAYLSRKDVVHLSELLNLPQSRIKIWFQNRRARERREFQITESLQ